MGDASFWQEAMHLLERKRGGYFFLMPLMIFLKSIAFASQVGTTQPVFGPCNL